MATPALELSRFFLPVRIRSKPGGNSGAAAQFEIIDRIAVLPHVQIVERSGSHGPITACVNLQPDRRAARRRSPPVLFCKVSPTGISAEGLIDSERHQVLCKGWGKLEDRHILLFLPRDNAELEVCSSILYRAYTSIINTPERLRTAPRVLVDDLPKPSRTSLT